MGPVWKVSAILVLMISLAVGAVRAVEMKGAPLQSLAAARTAGDGQTLLARYTDDTIELSLLDREGTVSRGARIARERGGRTASLTDLAVADSGMVYALLSYYDAETGEEAGQSLEVLDLRRLLFHSRQSYELESGEARYRWLFPSSSLMVLGVTDGGTLVREAYDYEALDIGAQLASKGTRRYALSEQDGIYQAVPVGTGAAYLSQSGKVFLAGEEGGARARELYPARELDRLMYPTFLFPSEEGTVIIGEQESGDFLELNLQSGQTQVVKSGSEPFSGQSSYVPRDVLAMSMASAGQFTAVVLHEAEQRFELVVSGGGGVSVIGALRPSLGSRVLSGVLWAVVCFASGMALCAGVGGFVFALRAGRRILWKLALSTIPLVAVSLVAFGAFSLQSYRDSIEESFRKQVTDEGSMLVALFGADSFDEIEFPYDYTGEAYTYLSRQLATREAYARTACFENGRLYIGVDRDRPCFYPFEMTLDAPGAELFERAAYSGRPQTGILDDARGRRISCVTPVGGSSGDTVYLLETGLPIGSMTRYIQTYVRNYALAAGLFTLLLAGVMLAVYLRALGPLGRIKNGLEEFARGDRSVRLECDTNDELADICRVFNKMAGDIDMQLYNLKRVSDIYYKFVPPQTFRLLGRESLGDVELGSGVEGEYAVLYAGIPPLRRGAPVALDGAGAFYDTLHAAVEENGALLLADRSSLRSFMVVCPKGVESAVVVALSAIARLDSANARRSVQSRMEPVFVIHRVRLHYGICGNEQRYFPAVASAELDWLTGQEAFFRQISSRLVVTGAAYEQLRQTRYAHRFIGYLEGGGGEERFGLYDFYDACTPEITRLIDSTRATFDKAMELYLQKRYYEAKNLFVLVLRDNQFDNVTRHYLFACEQHL